MTTYRQSYKSTSDSLTRNERAHFVVRAGTIGLASGSSVGFAQQQSSHNSGVVHCRIYDMPGSNKERLASAR
jgi:hypothetical protein